MKFSQTTGYLRASETAAADSDRDERGNRVATAAHQEALRDHLQAALEAIRRLESEHALERDRAFAELELERGARLAAWEQITLERQARDTMRDELHNARARAAAAEAELAALRFLLEQPSARTAAAGILRGGSLRDHVTRLLARLRFDHEERCSVVVANLRFAHQDLDEARADFHRACTRSCQLATALGEACAELDGHNEEYDHRTDATRVAAWRALAAAAGEVS